MNCFTSYLINYDFMIYDFIYLDPIPYIWRVIFVIDLAKFSHPRKLMSTIPVLCGSMMMGVGKNINHVRGSTANTSQCYNVSKQQWPLSSNTNILLSHAICPSLCRYGLVTKEITTALYWLLSQNLKPQKLILRAFSDFQHHTVSTIQVAAQ